MQGIKIIPHSRLKNENIKDILKGVHNPKSYIDRYNLKCLDSLRREGEPIPVGKLFQKGGISKALAPKVDSDLLILQDNFIYEIEITRNNVEFRVLGEDIERIKRVYSTFIKGIKFDEKSKDFNIDIVDKMSVCEMRLKDHFMFSLNSSEHRGLEPLRYILDIKRMLKDGEKFIYQVILHSLNNDWWNTFSEAYKTYKEGKMPKKDIVSVKELGKLGGDIALKVLLESIGIVEEIVFGKVEIGNTDLTEDSVLALRKDRGISRMTLKKGGEQGFETSIRGICYADTEVRRDFINNQFANCFNCLDMDNKLVKMNIKKSRGNMSRIANREIFSSFITSSKMILGVSEVSKLCYLPQVTLQRDLNMERLDFIEMDVPRELIGCPIPIGTPYGNKKNIEVGWSKVKDTSCFSKVMVGVKGSGKSVYLENYVYGAYKGGNCVIYFDYIENNINALEVSRHIPKEDVIILDLSKGFTFSYPELSLDNIPKDEEYKRTVKRLASEYCKLIEKFVNVINTEDTSDLTGNMRNILTSACSFAFISGNVELYSIYKILTDHRFRCNVVKKVREMEIYREDDFRFLELASLDIIETTPRSKFNKVVGTNNKAERVLDRFNALLRDSRTEEMLLGIDRNNINFIDVFNQNKVVLVLMPEGYFSDYELKDITMTYFLSRMWLCALKRAELIRDRDERNLVHIVLDEIHQLEHSTQIMIKNIAEDRKFRTSYVITCQYLKQFGNLWGAIKGSGCQYMLFSGTEKENFNMLKEEIGDNFTLEELLNIPKRHSLNIVKYNVASNFVFLSKLPDLLKNRLNSSKINSKRILDSNSVNTLDSNKDLVRSDYRENKKDVMLDLKVDDVIVNGKSLKNNRNIKKFFKKWNIF